MCIYKMSQMEKIWRGKTGRTYSSLRINKGKCYLFQERGRQIEFLSLIFKKGKRQS